MDYVINIELNCIKKVANATFFYALLLSNEY
jgi:hypothetical protein